MKLKELVFGARKSPLDPKVFEHLALAAFLAWVGLGADGLSSSCYGPEEIFKSLGEHRALAPILILALGLTVGILATGYSNTIEAFPGGGGGYIVATRELGRYPGLLCGVALIVDYILTIAISMSAGVEAIFSFLPISFQPYKLVASSAATLFLMLLNLRGVKESIKFLLPVFMGFLVTHAIAVVWALISHGSGVGTAVSASVSHARSLPFGLLALVLLKAYTVGAGTYTGIEAISNTVPLLKEPRVATAKRAMLYMAISLALTSGGLLLGYLLYGVERQPGMTLNASFLMALTANSPVQGWFVPLTLLTEGLLLFVAAQAGFVDGPRVMASMAVDSWVPRWFRHLSDRLVISGGILFIGIGGVLAVIFTGASVHTLAVIYAFSVFITFVLSQLGMCVHHLRLRGEGWRFRFAVNGTAFLLSTLVAIALVAFRFREGVLVGAVVITAVMGACVLVRVYYDRVGRWLKRLDRLRDQIEAEPPRGEAPSERNAGQPTAVVLVRSYGGPGIHTLMAILRTFPNYFRNFVFISVGDIDFDRFKSTEDVEKLKESVRSELEKYVALVKKWGYWAESRSAFGVDVVDEALAVCRAVSKEFSRSAFFAGQLVFEQPGMVTRLLHEQTAPEIQRRLQFEGLTLIILPIRVLGSNGAADK
ncbi:MAG TPA: APC family permease [Planctomycetota bacterium]